MDEHWNALASVAVTRESCAAITAIQEHVEGMERLIDRLITTCPESRPVIAAFAADFIKPKG